MAGSETFRPYIEFGEEFAIDFGQEKEGEAFPTDIKVNKSDSGIHICLESRILISQISGNKGLQELDHFDEDFEDDTAEVETVNAKEFVSVDISVSNWQITQQREMLKRLYETLYYEQEGDLLSPHLDGIMNEIRLEITNLEALIEQSIDSSMGPYFADVRFYPGFEEAPGEILRFYTVCINWMLERLPDFNVITFSIPENVNSLSKYTFLLERNGFAYREEEDTWVRTLAPWK